MEQVAVFGGTFDPVHWGHLVIAQTALSQLNLERVIWVPARHPPHKQGLTYKHRRFMVERAIADNPAFVLSPVEISHSGKDYAVETLAYLQDVYPNRQWYWIVGIDTFQTLPRWYCREKLIPACDWLVAPRSVPVLAIAVRSTKTNPSQEGTDMQASLLCQQVAGQLALQNISIRWHLLQMPGVSLSSTLIRQHCRHGHSIRYLVPEAVRSYITNHKLYSD